MANYLSNEKRASKPLILLIPGHAEGDSALAASDWPALAASDWMTVWKREQADVERLDLGLWDKPHRNTWVNRLNLAVHRAARPVILVAEDIGCLAVAWWAEYERPKYGDPVVGALLVTPPDVDRPGTDPRLASFGACPRQSLPFPSYLIADSRASQPKLVTATQLASDWNSHFTLDEIDSRGGEAAQYLLTRLQRDNRPATPRTAPARTEQTKPVAASVREVAHA